MDDRVEAGQASYEEVKSDIQGNAYQPKMEPEGARFSSRALRENAFLEIKEGYIDSGAAPGKDTRWKDVAQLKPQTITKEEVAARVKRHLLWVIPAGTVKQTKPKVLFIRHPRHDQSRRRQSQARPSAPKNPESAAATRETMKTPYVNELKPNQLMATSFLVNSKEIRQKKTGEFYLSLLLGDRTGELDAKMWDNVTEVIDVRPRRLREGERPDPGLSTTGRS